MGWQMTPFTVPLALTALLTLGIIVPVYRHRQKRAAVPLLAFMLFASVYGIGLGVRFSVTTLDAKLFWNIVAQIGRVGTPISLFLLAASYTDRRQWLQRRRIGVLTVIAVMQVMWPLFNPANTIFEMTSLATRDGMVFLNADLGLFTPLIIAVSYLFLSVGTYWLLAAYWEARGSDSVSSRQIGLVILAVLIPWGANALNIFGVTQIDYAPFGYTATSVLIATALFRYRLLDILPIARGTVVESMDNGVFVLDADGQIVDVNPRARDTIAVETDELVGQQFADVFGSYPTIVETVDEATQTSSQLSVAENGMQCHYEVTVSPIEDSFDNEIGRTVVLNDITVQVEREQSIDLMRQVLSRVLRHNIRNELQVVQGNTAMLASELEGRNEAIAQKALSGAKDLVSLSNKARGIEELVEQDHTRTEVDLVAMLEDAIESSREEFPAVSFTADLPESCEVCVIPAIHLAVENLIENAAEHNTSETPTVDVAVSHTDDAVTVTISDNGPGIPTQELAVLDSGAETDLEHGSGLGLWIVNWVVDDSMASIRYDTDSSGTEVTITIPTSKGR
jgi:PAS domain S-box-containing protein